MSKYKIDKSLIVLILLFICISLLSIYSSQRFLDKSMNNLVYKQLMWYIIGFVIIVLMMFIDIKKLYKYSWHLYIIGNTLLGLLLIFGKVINNAKCWFNIPYIGTFQPSEFMKIILIIVLSDQISKFNKKSKHSIIEELKFLLKIFLIILLPTILTFLEPDTGVVLIYLLITIIMLFIGGIRYRWFIILFLIIIISISSILIIYKTNQDLFIRIFGTSFFLRVDRLLDWQNQNGYQLSNGLISIGTASFLGHGFNKTPLYFPEAHTDFIFAVYSSNYGLFGSFILLGLITLFDIKLIKIGLKSKNNSYKYMIGGIVGMLMYQQFQNIGMTYGLLPITGITLPFISYGGSSLISYMIILGIVFNIYNKKTSIN